MADVSVVNGFGPKPLQFVHMLEGDGLGIAYRPLLPSGNMWPHQFERCLRPAKDSLIQILRLQNALLVQDSTNLGKNNIPHLACMIAFE